MKRILLFIAAISLTGNLFAQTLAPPIDFESTTIPYTFNNFDGGVVTVIPNAQVSGINTSATVGQMIKNVGQPWGGSLISMTAPIDFSTNKIFKMKVFSPSVGARVLLKVENQTNGGIFFEKEDTSTVANAWEELTFDFTAINTANSYQKIVLIWQLGIVGDGSANFTFLFDDIQLIPPTVSLSQIDLPVTFESATVDYTMTDFGGNAATVITDPVDPTNTVAEVVKSAAAQLWAGTTVSTPLGLDNAIPFTATDSVMSVRVWSPDANIPIRLKVEDHTNPTVSVETETMTTVAGQWETLVFNFNNQVTGTAAINLASTYDMASLFFDFGTDGATNGLKTYYFDDLMFGQPAIPLSQIDLPVTFESATVDYTMTDFGGNTATVITDPVDPTNTVAEVVKNASAQLWAGTTVSTPLGLANVIPFTVNDSVMSVRVWSPDANIPIRLKVEDHTNPTVSVETETMTTVSGQWETLVFNFNNEVTGTAAINLASSYDMASLFFDFGTDGATNGSKTYYFDDVMFGLAPVQLLQIDLPVTFEDSLVDYTMTDFGGNTATVITDPTDPTNTVAEVVKNASAQLWAGTTVSTPLGLANVIPFTVNDSVMSVRVWSPDANIPIRLKVEDHTNPTISVETETMTTVSGQWETLVFNFNNEVTGTAAINLANTYDMASLFFDFGTDGATNGLKTYYFDDVQMGPGCIGTTSSETFATCDPYTWNGNTYSSTGTYTYSTMNAGGCDSTVTLDLTINTATSASITVTGLDVYTAPSGATYATSGIYTDTVPNAAGCDSVITIDLTMSFTGLNEFEIGSFDLYPNPSSDKIMISISENFLSYPVVILDQGGRIVIEGQLNELKTQLNITPLENGLYYVKIGDLKAVKLVKN